MDPLQPAVPVSQVEVPQARLRTNLLFAVAAVATVIGAAAAVLVVPEVRSLWPGKPAVVHKAASPPTLRNLGDITVTYMVSYDGADWTAGEIYSQQEVTLGDGRPIWFRMSTDYPTESITVQYLLEPGLTFEIRWDQSRKIWNVFSRRLQ